MTAVTPSPLNCRLPMEDLDPLSQRLSRLGYKASVGMLPGCSGEERALGEALNCLLKVRTEASNHLLERTSTTALADVCERASDSVSALTGRGLTAPVSEDDITATAELMRSTACALREGGPVTVLGRTVEVEEVLHEMGRGDLLVAHAERLCPAA